MSAHVDLHMHSCLSPCGDELMTPNNIAGMAMLKGLDIIAVCDHNSARNLPAVQAACDVTGVVLLPGLELNTAEEAHLLAYFPELEAALAFGEEIYQFLPDIKNVPELFGEQLIMDENDEIIGREPKLLISALRLSFDALVDMINARGGAAVPAHINRGSNGLLNALGFIPEHADIAAVELSRAVALMADVSKYRALYSSDAHYLENMLEAVEELPISEKSARAAFEYIKRGAM